MNNEENCESLLLDAHSELLLAKKHINESLHEAIDGTGRRHDAESRRYYAEMAAGEIESAYNLLNEAIKLYNQDKLEDAVVYLLKGG